MKKLFKLLTGLGIFALPALALAQTNSVGGTSGVGNVGIQNLLSTVSSIFGILIPILVTFAVIYIIVGVIRYATANDDETQATARASILHGIIALFVIVSIWGLVGVLNNTFGINQNGTNFGACQPVYTVTGGVGSYQLPAGC
jgi:hypothetical protein